MQSAVVVRRHHVIQCAVEDPDRRVLQALGNHRVRVRFVRDLLDEQGRAYRTRGEHRAAHGDDRGKAAWVIQCDVPAAIAAHRHAGQVLPRRVGAEFSDRRVQCGHCRTVVAAAPFLVARYLREHHQGGEIGMRAQVRPQPGVGLLDAIGAALARAVQEQDDRKVGGSGGLHAGRNEHLVVRRLPVHLHRTCFEAATRAVRQRSATAHHQKGQQWQPARQQTDHGIFRSGEIACIVVRRRRPGIVRRVTAGAGSWR